MIKAIYRQNKQLWQSGLTIGAKAQFAPRILYSYSKLLVTGQKNIRYLDSIVEYDNLVSPLSLQRYPYEITHKIIANTTGKIENVLDLGANIGQFALTLSAILRHKVQIDSFEPNPSVFRILTRNTSSFNNITIYNLGISPKKQMTLNFVKGKSATGSFHKENAGKSDLVEEVKVKNTNNIASVTGRNKYDLIKIDVEGYEYDLIKSIKPIKTRYLFLEVSGTGRYKDYNHSAIYDVVRKKFGNYDIIYQSRSQRNINNFDVLFEIK